jgi:hypothetical protein
MAYESPAVHTYGGVAQLTQITNYPEEPKFSVPPIKEVR